MFRIALIVAVFAVSTTAGGQIAMNALQAAPGS